MKITLTLTHDDENDPPQERDKLELTLRARDFVGVISALDNWLRNQLKHDTASGELRPGLEAVRAELWRVLEVDGLADLFDRVRW